MKAGRMRRRIGRTPAEQPVEPAGEIVPLEEGPCCRISCWWLPCSPAESLSKANGRT